MHVMIDLETLGTGPSAPVVQIAAVAFELAGGGRVFDGKALSVYVDPDTQRYGHTDRETFAWWLQQSDRARERLATGLFHHAKGIGAALNELALWPEVSLDCSWATVEGVWAKPSTFDLPILKYHYRANGSTQPWHRRTERDVRTYAAALGWTDLPPVATGGVEHDALDDCVWQISQLQALLDAVSGR